MDNEYRRLAARYIRRQAKQLAAQLDGVRAAEDLEFVHRARVATRRLRAAFRLFDSCFAGKRVKRWQKAIRRLTSSLGSARDCDVQIDWLCGALASLDARECFPGLARVLVQLEHDRERLQHRVVAAVDRLAGDGVLREMRRTAKNILGTSAATPLEPQSPEACAHIKRHIDRQWNRLRKQQDSLTDPEDRQRHHDMRIAAKRLRYVLEISRPACAGRFDRALEAIKRVQTLLGDIHDCDVWLDHLDAFASSECERLVEIFGHSGRFLLLRPGIEYLRNDRRAHRQKTFAELVNYWNDLNNRGLWNELLDQEKPNVETADAFRCEIASDCPPAPTTAELLSRSNPLAPSP